jgi:hypothetical protein
MANPTTNYGFVLPTSTDLVTDLPADFDVALQGVDTRLKALQPGTTLGDLAYSSATANTNTRLAIGTTGNVLTVSGGVPVWAAPAGGGKVLQVVFASTTTEVTNSTSTYSDTGCTVSITPSSASSRIMLIVNHNGWNKSSADTGNFIETQLLRGATQIMFTGNGNRTTDQTLDLTTSHTMMYVDSPSTTSSTTYKTQFRNGRNGSQIGINYGGSRSTIVAVEIGA